MCCIVSIFITCYNAEQWISKTINSALAQTWRYKEILDDGYIDRTYLIANNFESPNYLPAFDNWRGQLLNHLFRWKAARKANALYHRYKNFK